MNADRCQQLMQVTRYPTFLIEICDKALSDTNISKVDDAYKHFRNSSHVPLHLEKLLFYVFKTLPQSDTLLDIYRHVSIVSKYCMCVLSTASVSHKRASPETNSALSEDQLLLLITHQNEVLDDWEIMIEQEMNKKNKVLDLEIMEKIRWTVKLTKLTITEYL